MTIDSASSVKISSAAENQAHLPGYPEQGRSPGPANRGNAAGAAEGRGILLPARQGIQ